MKSHDNLTELDKVQVGVENSIRTYLQMIPGFGGALNQAIFGTHDIMQIKRIEKYINEFKKLLDSGAIQEDALAKVNEYITSDDGQEYIYLIFDKVKKTRNDTKIEYLRNLFINHSSVDKPMDIDNAERYVNMIENLDVESVLILKFLRDYDDINVPKRAESGKKEKGEVYRDIKPQVAREIPAGEKNKLTYLDAVAKEFGFDIEDLNYYHQQLITNGVAIDDGMGRLDAHPLKIMKITQRGEYLLRFIDEPSWRA